nr:response regulator transcription factor [Catenulispora acidiphila]
MRQESAMRVVLAEDQALLRDGLVRLLTAHGFEVVAAVETGPDLLDALVAEKPDVAVADIRLPPTFKNEGLAAALEARRRVPGLPVLILSQHVEPLYARELLSDSAGAIGYLLKDRVSNVRSFLDAVRTVAGGGTAMDPEVIATMLARRSRDERLGSLTRREREVLAAMAEGHANAGIAGRLVITEKAVSNHINTIFAKLGLLPDLDGNRRVLAVLAYLDAA